MRSFAICCSAILLGTGIGCAASQPAATDVAQLTPPLEPPTELTASSDDSLVGLWDIRIDPADWSATITPSPTRTAESSQAIRYDLDIEDFLNADSLQLAGLTVADGSVKVDLLHAHPFPAPDFSKPISGLNRADLGYTGRLLVISTAGSQSFFGGGVECDPSFLANADGYVRPGDLLRNVAPAGYNSFAYKLLVDDFAGTRVGVAPGPATGNYLPGSGGWQRGNIAGPSGNDGWTGYDYLHGGQSSRIQLEVALEALEETAFTFTTAILIQYTDPRGNPPAGGELRDRRFPPVNADPLAFAYRLPFSALDNSVLAVDGPVSIGAGPGSATALELRVRDWDAGATESTDLRLDDQADVSLIQRDAGGYLNPALSAPDFAATVPSFAHQSGTGLPGNELRFTTTLTNVLGTSTPGRHYAMVRVIDPEDSDANRDTYHFGVDPVTLVPDAARAVQVRNYQVIPIDVQGDGWVRLLSSNQFSYPWEVVADAEGNIYVAGEYASDLGLEGSPLDPVLDGRGNSDIFIARYSPTGSLEWVRNLAGVGNEVPLDMAVDPAGSLYLVGDSYSEEIDMDPTLGLDLQENLNPLYSQFMALKLNSDGSYAWGHYWGGQNARDRITGVCATADWVYLGMSYADAPTDLDPGPAVATRTPLGEDAGIMALTPAGIYNRSAIFSGPEIEAVGTLSTDPAGNLYMGGLTGSATLDFDPGVAVSTPPPVTLPYYTGFICTWTSEFDYRWHAAFESDKYEQFAQLLVGDESLYAIANYTGTSFDIDPGPGVHEVPAAPGATNAGVLLSLKTSDGDFLWGHGLTTDNLLEISDLALLNKTTLGCAVNYLGAGDLDPTAGTFPVSTSALDADTSLLRFSTGGLWIGGVTWNSPTQEVITSLTTSPFGNPIMAGQFRGTLDFDAGPGVHERTPTHASTGFLLHTQPTGAF